MDVVSSQIESLLFVAGKALTLKEISKIIKIKPAHALEIISQIQNKFESSHLGIRLTTNGHKVELVTAPKNASVVKHLVELEKASITQAQIETLTILGYRGPLTKAELEDQRGVNCSLILKNLMIAGLIDEINEKNTLSYQVSNKFLKALGLTSVNNLPDYQKLHINSAHVYQDNN